MTEHLFFVGPGRAGLALAYALWQTDVVGEITFCGRRPEPPAHPLFTQGIARYCFGLEQPGLQTTAVFLSVPDDALPEMAHALAGQGAAPAECAAFHLSGALSTDILAPLHARGYRVGSLHPLQALANPVTGAARLPGSWFAVSGEPQALHVGRRLLAALDARSLTIPVARRPLYHAAAVVASNFVPALLAVAGRLLVQAGVSAEDALQALIPLTRGTVENVAEMGLGPSLTGPIPRGDLETIRLHLRSLEPREREVYRTLGRELVLLARSWGLDEEVALEVEGLLAEGTNEG